MKKNTNDIKICFLQKNNVKIIPVILLIISITLTLGLFSVGCYDNHKNTAAEAVSESQAETTGGQNSPGENETTQTENTEDKMTINVASLKGPSSIGMVKLHDQKSSLPDGTIVNYEIVPTPDAMIAKILSKEIDMATLPTNVAVKLFNKGTEIKLTSIVGYGVLYLVYQNIEVNNWEDLKNNTIYVTAKGSTPDIILRYLLAENNLTPDKDIILDYSLEQVELSQLIIANKANIAVLPEPFVTMVLSKNKNAAIAFDLESEWAKSKNGLSLPMTCFVATKQITENNPMAVDEFLNLYEQSINWIKENPEDAAELVEKLDIGMNRETAIEAIPRCNVEFTPSKEAKEAVNSYINAILDFSPEDIGGKMPDESFYY